MPEDQIRNVKNSVALLRYDIMCAHNKKIDEREIRALEKIKANPKFFYSYAKSLSKILSSINMLFDGDKEITTDPQKMADLLQAQFTSVFSDPSAPNVTDP